MIYKLWDWDQSTHNFEAEAGYMDVFNWGNEGVYDNLYKRAAEINAKDLSDWSEDRPEL